MKESLQGIIATIVPGGTGAASVLEEFGLEAERGRGRLPHNWRVMMNQIRR